MIDSAEACRHLALLHQEVRSEADIAAEHGLSPVSFAIYELLNERSQEVVSPSQLREEKARYRTSIDEGTKGIDESTKGVALKVQAVVDRHYTIVDWQSNLEILREMRRDIKRELRPTGDYTEAQLDELANRIVEMARRRSER